jgi:hypothetical protein
VNDADRLSREPAMRCVVGDRPITGSAASASAQPDLSKEYRSANPAAGAGGLSGDSDGILLRKSGIVPSLFALGH